MATTLKQFQNPDGTYNGVQMMAAVSGLSPAEIRWTMDRCKYLMHVEKKSKAETVAILKAETATKPWLV